MFLCILLYIYKRKYSFFHKQNEKDDILLLFPRLKISNYEIKRPESIASLGVLLDENLTREPHIKYSENETAKNVGLLFICKPFVNKQSLLSL